MVLTGQPLSPVRLTVESGDTDEATVDVSELIFTGENWNEPQTVTVTGVDDGINDATQSVNVTLAIDPAESNDLFDAVSSQTVSADVDGLPSLDGLSDVTAAEDAANILVDLTGISAGGGDAQPIRVTAASSDPSLATVSVSYTDPAATGELTIDPQLNATGEAVIEVTVEDGGLDADLSTADDNQFATQRFELRLTPVNDEPVITVPGAITVEEDERFNFEPGATGTFVVTDVDASTLRATVSVSNGVLIVPDGVFGLSIDGTRAGDDSLTFLGSQVAINRALNRLLYQPNADFTGSDTLNLTISDRGLSGSGGVLEASDSVAITVLNDDDPPRNEVPDSQTIAEDTSLVFGESRRIAVSDVDAPAGGLQVSLTATNGVLDLSTTNSLSFSAGGDGTTAMTFSGQIADINAALNGLEFSPNTNFNGAAEILIETRDPAVGASSTDSDRIEITVSAVNDEPENSLPAGPLSTQEDTPLVFSGGNTISISDAADGDQGNMQVALLVSSGLLELSGTADLDFSIGSGRDQLMRFSGTVANVNAALNGLTFIPTRDFSGNVELRIVTSDLGNTGDGPELLDRDELTINVTSVDDAPTGQPDLYFVRVLETLSASDALGTTTITTQDNGLLANDSDPDTDQDQLAATLETVPPFVADFLFMSNGTFSYRTTMAVVEDTFTYRATDHTTPSAPVAVTIRVNHPPVVTASTFTLAEGPDAGTSVGQVQATDLNTTDHLQYEILEGNTGGAFAINNETGQLTVANSSALNFETNPVFELSVRVTDNAPEFVRSSTVQTIRVELTDVSEALEITEGDWESDGLTIVRDGSRIRIVR
ncbi:MAG: cadherin domain-containing protein, partial [Planctomycetes bacterium]|nr:cadherin domain-containing protein [Planctomycetota bacterium]